MSDSTLRAYYAARAREYERVYAKPERQADLRVLQQRIPALLAGRHVLEIACGTGWWTAFIAHAAARLTALDATAEVLAVAAAKGLPTDRVRWVRASAHALPFAAGTFDAAFAGFWWSHLPVRARADWLRGLSAAMAPGARLVMVDNRWVAGSSTPIARRDADGNSWQQRRLDDGSTHEVLKNFPAAGELRADLAPFARDVQVDELAYFWLLTATLH